MDRPKIKVKGVDYDILQLKWLSPEPIPHFFQWKGETVYIEYGIGYKKEGELYMSSSQLDLNKEF